MHTEKKREKNIEENNKIKKKLKSGVTPMCFTTNSEFLNYSQPKKSSNNG